MKTYRKKSKEEGFTLIEMVTTLAILSILALAVFPMARIAVIKNKEVELRRSLRIIREAIDGYKKVWDEGKIEKKLGESGYPPNLEILVTGVEDKTSPTKKKIFLLRRIPRDPLNTDTSIPPEKTWGMRSYDSEYNEPKEGDDLFDVYSKSQKTALDGTKYSEW